MAAISDINFIVMSYNQDIKNPSKEFFTVLAKKLEILDAAVEDNISKKKFFYKIFRGLNQATLAVKRSDFQFGDPP